MRQSFLKSRRVLAILLVAVLALVQVKITFAGCMAADTTATMSATAMDDCPGCHKGAANETDSYDFLSRICTNHCLQNVVFSGKVPAQPTPAATTVALHNKATAPPAMLSLIHPSPPGKTRLIYRLQRLLI